MSDVDLLRRAAALMREHAEGTTPGRWYVAISGDVRARDTRAYVDDKVVASIGHPVVNDAVHIASWQPAVALTVADWLEDEANLLDGTTEPEAWAPKAFAAARAYLGGPG